MNINYTFLAGAVLWLICAVIHIIKRFVKEKDFSWSSCLTVIIQIAAFVSLLVLAFKY